MERSVSKIGPSTLMVSLPSKWAKDYGVKKGDKLHVETIEGTIQFSLTPSTQKKKTASITINNQKEFRRYVNALYEEGYNEIKITSKTDLNIATIIKDVDMLTGFQVTTHTSTTCTIKSVAEETTEEFENILKRIFLINLSMARGITTFCNNKNQEQLQDNIFLEHSNNTLTTLCKRMLSKKGYKEPAKTGMMYSLLSYLETIADHYRDICNILQQSTPNKEVIKVNNDIQELLETLYLHHKKLEPKIQEFMGKRKKILLILNRRLTTSTSTTTLVLAHLQTIIRILNEVERLLTVVHL